MSQVNIELEQLRIAEQVARMGSYTWDLETNGVHWSPGMFRLLDVPDGINSSFDLWMAHVRSDYLDLAMRRADNGTAGKRADQLEYPMVTMAEREIWVRVRSRPVELLSRPSVIGVAFDITASVMAQQEMHDLNEMLARQLETSADLVRLLEQARTFPRQQYPELPH